MTKINRARHPTRRPRWTRTSAPHRLDPAASIRRKPARSSSPNRADADVATTGQRADHHVLRRGSVRHDIAGRHGAAAGTVRCRCTADPTDRETISPSLGHRRSRHRRSVIDHHVRLHGSRPVLDRGIEIGRPRHAVPRGKHRCHTGFGNQAVSERRPLRTPVRHDCPAGPGAHPQPEAVHAGTAPVIRLERPLALCHDSLLVASGIVLDPVPHAGWSRLPSRSPDRLCVSLVTGAAPGLSARIAAVSPTFGRLYEGTDRSFARSNLACDGRPAGRRSLTDVTPATGPPSNLLESLPQCCRTVGVSRGKLLASGSAVSDRNGARQRSEDGRSASWPTDFVGCLERRSRVPSGVSCGTVVAVLSTPVDNHVDSSSSLPKLYVDVISGGPVVDRGPRIKFRNGLERGRLRTQRRNPPGRPAPNGEPYVRTADTSATSVAEPRAAADRSSKVLLCSSVPSSFVQNEIERHLRTQITEALSRRLGQQIELGVRISPLAADESEDATGAVR